MKTSPALVQPRRLAAWFAALLVAVGSLVAAPPASANGLDATSMSLTGTAAIGEDVTVAFLDGFDPVGSDFDLWACPDTSIKPRDNGESGSCFGPNIESQMGRSTTFTLDESYASFCNWLLIVNDYPNGGHSNWIGPLTGVENCPNELATSPDAPSTDATLSGLALSAGTLSPAFDAATAAYTASVPNGTTSVSVTPTTAHASATVTVDGATATSGQAVPVELAVGDNTITVVVTAQDGTTTATSTITVTRAPSSDAALSGLALSAGTLSRVFDPATTAYTVAVPHSVISVSVTPTVAHASATVTVRGTSVASGSAVPVALLVGANAVPVVVTAEDGTTTTTTTVTVHRFGAASGVSPTLPPAPVEVPGTTELPLPTLGAGTSLVGGTPAPISVTPKPSGDGVHATGPGFGLELVPSDADGSPAGGVSESTLLLQAGAGARVSLHGFAPGSPVRVWLFSEPSLIGEFTTDRAGTLDAAFTAIAGSTAACRHTLQAEGVLASGAPVSVAIGVAVLADPYPFADVDPTGAHGWAVGCLESTGIAAGVADGRFDASGPVTRGQAASLVARALGLAGDRPAPFADVIGNVHAPAVAVLSEAGTLRGFGDGSFRPNQPLTRGQTAALLARAFGVEPRGDARFPDTASGEHAAAIAALVDAGVIDGFEDGTFRPSTVVTRGQFASMLAGFVTRH